MSLTNLKKDDVLVAKSGYEQTNVYYFLVLKRTAKSVVVKRLKNNDIEYNGQAMRGLTVPILNEFIGEEARHKVFENYNKEECIKTDFGNAYLWNKEPQCFTTYG